jgi:hypothetical protein
MKLEEPTPVIPRGENALQNVAWFLKDNPGRWLLLGVHPGTPGAARTYAWSIGAGAPDTLQGRVFGVMFQAQTKTVCGEQRIYVRYTGSQQ